MNGLDIVYFVLIGLNFIVSIYFKNLWKQLFFLYFALIILVEIIILYNRSTQILYNYLDLFSILYFGWLVGKTSLYKKGVYGFTFIALLIAILKLDFHSNSYAVHTGIVFGIYAILLSLFWFMETIYTEKGEEPLFKRQLFWICSSLLLWSVFYLFRMIPMYLFNEIDKEFLKMLRNIFQITNIVSYGLFLRGLFCKK